MGGYKIIIGLFTTIEKAKKAILSYINDFLDDQVIDENLTEIDQSELINNFHIKMINYEGTIYIIKDRNDVIRGDSSNYLTTSLKNKAFRINCRRMYSSNY